MGADNAIRITTGDAQLDDFRADPTITWISSSICAQKQAASDAELVVDGITVKEHQTQSVIYFLDTH